MCIGIPMQVMAIEPGYAVCAGRGERRRVSSALVGDCQQGDWLLVFLDSARERIDALRAHEIDATLDMLQAALLGLDASEAQPRFELPSAMAREDLAVLSNSRDSSSY
ncbi:Hydrogenase expression/formation protein HoxL (plasmid) [Cupriavidus necator H16]|uniref:Hydrogenase expression/formation protein HoxL n=2 Tax=Cupriavidus necator (strain ATCC 17699 / DSM 428 / KCTC 22496 / NCIMB 10442 / H16 / Stanier 337) TaxID=381666 RepID=HOXL_CUPNH|nr:HypC/HybG/HupF family hydrogenase formation chaperone [Cupriavidus necator]P31899.2 RecName: Full=Hydrogenase expression/formation protein HoxL [Cupriavidus necator H16]AAP85762.1 HoxL [Cupriavidus necator H16]QCC05294.1 HypC/HybG/HupF family hydrogenase formation chaperone [Cupriavidus necator H16]QQB81465.1 HypC/HybG/HupF family hydrogenase formation chaperone [Cupriavidus necator]